MEPKQTEKNLANYLPSQGTFALHLALMTLAAFVLGPLLGPIAINWINPTQAWGVTMQSGDYSVGKVILWGLAFLMFEALGYTAWIISHARKRWSEQNQQSSWYN